MVLIVTEYDYDCTFRIELFPSPCGDYCSYRPVFTFTVFLKFTHSFRPLAGIMVLIIITPITETVVVGYVSVPLRGLWFLSTYDI